MRDNVLSIAGLMADGTHAHFGTAAEPKITNLSREWPQSVNEKPQKLKGAFPR